MDETQETLAIYLHLARASELRRRWLVRDKLLLIAALRAHALGLGVLAAHCRERLLAHNPGHLLGHFDSMEAAAGEEPVRLLALQAERVFAREKAEHMLQTLGVELGRADATYESPAEYLASILGPSPRMAAERDHVAAPDAATKPPRPVLSAAEIAAREHDELRILLTGLAALTVVIVAWSAILLQG